MPRLPGHSITRRCSRGQLPAPPALALSPDDLYILYTGGTTGHPKGTLWRQADIFDSTLAALVSSAGIDATTLEALEVGVKASEERRALPAPPLMHGAGQWVALGMMLGGGTVVFPDVVEQLDARSILDGVDREQRAAFSRSSATPSPDRSATSSSPVPAT